MKRLKEGCGYWDVTIYPIGGCFRRAINGGLILKELLREYTPDEVIRTHGTNQIWLTEDNRQIALHSSHVEDL